MSEALTVPTKQELIKSDVQSAKQTRLAAFTPANLTEAIALAKMMAGSDIVPRDFQKKPGNIIVAIQFGAEIGLAPMQSLQSVAVINGRPTLWGDGALALVQGHPDFEDIQETTDGTVATCIVKRRGRTPCKRTFSDEDAAKAGLLGKSGPWNQYRGRMRQMRARGFCLRDSFADVLKGISIAEEAMDIPVDNSGAKQQRESMTFDVGMLTPSAEPNRGHNDTGLQRSKPDEQAQPDAKQAPTMCADCQRIDGHEPTCKYFAQAEQDRKTSKGTTKGLYLILSVEERTTKKKAPYLVLNVVTTTPEGDKEGKLYVWNKALHGYLVQLSDKTLVGEVSESEKDGKPFVQLEHILELNGVAFVNDLPAQQGTLEIPATQSPEEEF